MKLIKSLLWILSLFGSLISFPSVFPWVIGGWVAFASLMWFRGRPSHFLFAIPVGLVCIKWPEFSICLIACCSTWTLCAASSWKQRPAKLEDLSTQQQPSTPSKTTLALISASLMAWFVYALDFHNSSSGPSRNIDLNRPVVCIGDSLTDFGYPQDLQKRIRVPIVDLGFNGYTTEDGIRLIPNVKEVNPQAVILELGGHDFKDGKPRTQTLANLEKLIEAFEEVDAEVIIVEIPRGFVNDPYRGLERELARKYDLELIPDTMIRRLIFWSPIVPPGAWVTKDMHNSKDGLHPNERGNQLMADFAVRALTRVFTDEIKR